MIDKIEITLSDSGFVNVNIGDVHFMHSNDTGEVLLNIAAAIKKLAYFPKGTQDISKPITYEEFKSKYKKQKVVAPTRKDGGISTESSQELFHRNVGQPLF